MADTKTQRRNIPRSYVASDEQREKLKRLAEHENRTMSQQINFLVDKRCEELGIVIEGKE